MGMKYDISMFNKLSMVGANKKEHSIPTNEVFNYIYQKARDGNEMAAIQLYEWLQCCSPKTEKEKMEYKHIHSAFNNLFKKG